MRLLVVWKDLDDDDLARIEQETGATVLKGFTKEEALKFAPDADVILGWAPSDVLAKAIKCRWLQAPYAGAERILAAKWGNPQMVFTNGRGIFGANISEHVLGFILSFNRGLHLARDQQNQKIWNPNLPIPFRELTDSTVGILGFGDIGSQVAKRLHGFDCRVLAFRQHPRGDEPYTEAVYGIDRFSEFLGEFDYLVCTVPETPRTIGFLNKNLLQKLPEHALVVNVGRGSLIPGEDLILALQEGWVAGAALDVTDPEPLPADSVLWTMPNVIITPHNSGLTTFHKKRALDIFSANFKHFKADGSPKINVVNKDLGY